MKKSTLFSFLAIIIGSVIVYALYYLFKMLIAKYYPMPLGLDINDEKNMLIFSKSGNGFWNFAYTALSYMIAIAIGTFAAGKIALKNGIIKGVIVGIFSLGFIYILNQKSWHPDWFLITTYVSPIPLSIVASSFAVYWAKEDEAAIPDDEEIKIDDILHPSS